VKFCLKINVEEALKLKRKENLDNLVREANLDLNGLEQICNRIAESCTKDAMNV
jgi:hypothetical protein